MTDIKQIYTSHQSLVGTVTPSVIRTVPFPSGATPPRENGTVRITSGVTVPDQRLALACQDLYNIASSAIPGGLPRE